MYFRLVVAFFFLFGAYSRCVVAAERYELDRHPLLGEILLEDSETDAARLGSPTFSLPSPFTKASLYDVSSKVSVPAASSIIDSGDVHSPPMTLFGKARYTALPRPTFSPPETTHDSIKEQTLFQRQHNGNGRLNPIAITFGILGAFIGLIVLLLCGRSIHHYIRTPRRDLVADHIDRYNLESELAELEEARLGMLSIQSSVAQPPPPYQEEPSFENVTKYTRVTASHPQSSQVP